ncbi:hypothetical protein JMX53_00050 [Cutibacterium avidum]|uniref:hypothetical protein n=1 Tax=Cutibacterium avidum TaxID=33010 RepID=UPI00192AD88B|nr:hypothetical protein [Cutibacterium avidum]QQY15065.1 hypothetical protein JMX53_00050 [Cutibacterium avidum]
MSDIITDICALVPNRVFDGRCMDDKTYPFSIVTQRDCQLATTLGDRPLWHVTVDVMAVSNNPAGTRLYTRRVVDALDGQRIDGYRLTHVTSGPVLADRGDPTDWCWTCTNEFRITTPRRPRD